MDRADEIVPGMARGQFANPGFLAGNKINFHGQFDGQPRVIATSLLAFFNVFIKICLKHVPIIPIIPRHGVVFGKADFGETERERLGVPRREDR